MEYLHEKHFSLIEAQETLSSAKANIQRISNLSVDLAKQSFDVYRGTYMYGLSTDMTQRYPPDFEELVELARELEVQGIVIKGLEDGIIDFPHINADGEEIYLCWKLGEDGIEFWHRIEDGFAGRRPVAEL
jgi:hypothetical protein